MSGMQPELTSLWDAVAANGANCGEFRGRDAAVSLAQLGAASMLPGSLESLRGRAVLVATDAQLPTALALLELDGVVRRMVLCTPELTREQLAAVAAHAQADAMIVSDTGATSAGSPHRSALPHCALARRPIPAVVGRRATERTEWILLTSGTTGTPKLVVHTLASLAGSLPRRQPAEQRAVWSTFYDIRRYGGLQIYLRAVLGGAPLVLSGPESTGDFLARAGAAGVTHISGTPSHWRRVLMSGAASAIDPGYVRLSGEVADQPLLDGLRAAYPKARVAHAFASTEAGVAFDVNDGLAGFPGAFVDRGGSAGVDVDLKVTDGTLRIRSPRVGTAYLGEQSARLADDEGFVDTGDFVERVADRYHFRGRRDGVINVGGMKVYPEEVEAVLNADPRVRMSLVRARRSPITGAIVVADIVLSSVDPATVAGAAEQVKSELIGVCRQALAAHKVPTMLRIVPALEMTAAGKLVRPNA